MARVQNTLIGKSSGSVGGATFSTWKGINVLKSKAISVANPKTVAQQTQRNRMALMVAIFRSISIAVVAGFKTLAIGKSEYNAFVSANIQDAVSVGIPPQVEIDQNKLLVSKGTIGITPINVLSSANGSDAISISWNANNPIGGAATDVPYVVIYNATQDTWEAFATADTRADGATIVQSTEDNVTGDFINAYLFFKSADSDEVSDSFHKVQATV